ncbi:MAG: hypothetical protein DMG18_05665 [Acidobacteria bacterium]|nr:MAG: hypothetical protein DMG18_05665 [Acidobacteriota bacterium]
MAFLSEENQREIKTIFEQLDRDVHLEFFTERESPIIIPGGNCPTCKDTRLLLQEVVALSDKLHLDVHEVTTTGEAARQQGIDRIPALIMSAEGVQGKSAILVCRPATNFPSLSAAWWTYRGRTQISPTKRMKC